MFGKFCCSSACYRSTWLIFSLCFRRCDSFIFIVCCLLLLRRFDGIQYLAVIFFSFHSLLLYLWNCRATVTCPSIYHYNRSQIDHVFLVDSMKTKKKIINALRRWMCEIEWTNIKIEITRRNPCGSHFHFHPKPKLLLLFRRPSLCDRVSRFDRILFDMYSQI